MAREKGKKSAELKVKQDAFCKLMLRGHSCKEAAELLGVAYCTTNRWLKDPYVAKKIEHSNKKAMYEAEYKKADWLRDMLEVLDRNMGRKPYQPVQEGEEPKYRFVSAEARKTLEILGKHLGIYADKVDITANGKIEICWKTAESVPDVDILDAESTLLEAIPQ